MARKKICAAGGKHLVSDIRLRGKDDSYYLDCANCVDPGEDSLVAIWFDELPAWGLGGTETRMLHEAFHRIRYVQQLSIEKSRRKK